MITGNLDLVKQLNKWLIVNTVLQAEAISRADLAKRIGLNSATVSNLVTELLAEELVEQVGLGESQGGRPPVLLRVKPNGVYSVGVKIRPDSYQILILNLSGQVVARSEVDFDNSALPSDTIVAMAEEIRALVAGAQIPWSKLAWVGVAAPGVRRPESGLMVRPVNLPGWREIPVQALLETQLGLPVMLEKDSVAGAVGELWHGVGRLYPNLIYLQVDTGIGAGLVLGGQIQRGSRGGAGEIGHITVDPHGTRCSCGNYGCLETVASGWAIRKQMGGADLETVLAQARAGEPRAVEVLSDAGRYLAMATVTLVSMYDPDAIVVGGSIPLGSPLVVEAMRSALERRSPGSVGGEARVLLPEYGIDACGAGAATMMLGKHLGPVKVVTGRA